MSEIMRGVLNMPPELWTNDPIDVAQRHAIYREAWCEIDRLQAALAEIKRLASEHYDPDADVADQSPEDMHAFRNGLIVQLCEKARHP